MNIFIIVFGIIIGFLIAKLFSGKKEGEQGRLKSLKFNIYRYTIHLHHWLVASIIIVIFITINYFNNIIYSILIGILVQGLTYRDFYKIAYKTKP